MSISARDIIRSALLEIGAIAAGEAPSADEASDGLRLLNGMLASWSTENLIIFSNTREVFPLVSAQSTYSIGTVMGADFSTDRPLSIQSAKLVLTTSTPVVELPMRILNFKQFADIKMKQLQSAIPQFIYSDNNFPLANLELYPVPNFGNSLALYTSKPLANIASINDVLDLPPGYDMAIWTSLGVRMCPTYGKSASAELAMAASESKANIKRMNTQPQYLEQDNALLSDNPHFNFFSGD